MSLQIIQVPSFDVIILGDIGYLIFQKCIEENLYLKIHGEFIILHAIVEICILFFKPISQHKRNLRKEKFQKSLLQCAHAHLLELIQNHFILVLM